MSMHLSNYTDANLREYITSHKANLRKLSGQHARHGDLYVPPHIQTQIDDLNRQIRLLERELEKRQQQRAYHASSADDEEEEYTYAPEPARVPQNDIREGLILIAGMIGVVLLCTIFWSINSYFENRHTCKHQYCLDFESDRGLREWKSDGVAPTIIDSESYNRSDGVRVPIAERSILYNNIGPSIKGEQFRFVVWCKAPVDAQCRIFVGTQEQGTALPIINSERTITRLGTGNWESLEVNFDLVNDEDLFVFLYGEGKGKYITYSDLGFSKSIQ